MNDSIKESLKKVFEKGDTVLKKDGTAITKISAKDIVDVLGVSSKVHLHYTIEQRCNHSRKTREIDGFYYCSDCGIKVYN